MSAADIRRLRDNEDNVYLWVEQASSIMLKAIDATSGDPVELSPAEARALAGMLLEAAASLNNA